MSKESVVRDLFDRWERVWHEGRYDLVAGCVTPVYTRHDESGTRQLTPEEYAAEIATARQERPNTRFIVYDHEIAGDRVWFRFTWTWSDASTGEKCTQAGMQLYRIGGDKLAETWLTLLKIGSAWPDAVEEEHWTNNRLGHLAEDSAVIYPAYRRNAEDDNEEEEDEDDTPVDIPPQPEPTNPF
jgi:hypothetical protein